MLIVVICFLFVFIGLLCFKLYQFSLIILNIETAIEESLDELNEKYLSLGKIIEKEIFFDSIEVRQAIADIKDAHDSILRVAQKITKDIKAVNEIENKESS